MRKTLEKGIALERAWPIKSIADKHKVEVVRYFRTYDTKYQQWSNTNVMTSICVLNYSTMTITMYPSFCSSGDNFCKSIGKYYANLAKHLGLGFIIPLDSEVDIQTNLLFAAGRDNIVWLSDASKHRFKFPLKKWLNNQDEGTE